MDSGVRDSTSLRISSHCPSYNSGFLRVAQHYTNVQRPEDAFDVGCRTQTAPQAQHDEIGDPTCAESTSLDLTTSQLIARANVVVNRMFIQNPKIMTFETTLDERDFLQRAVEEVICQFPQCSWLGSPTDLRHHLEHHHYPDNRLSDHVYCQWTPQCHTKTMQLESLNMHILSKHLLVFIRHCPFCHIEIPVDPLIPEQVLHSCHMKEEVLFEIMDADLEGDLKFSWRECMWCRAEVSEVSRPPPENP